MPLSATYNDGGKTKKACVLPPVLVSSARSGASVIADTGKWARIWPTNAGTKRPDGTKITVRNLKYTIRAKR